MVHLDKPILATEQALPLGNRWKNKIAWYRSQDQWEHRGKKKGERERKIRVRNIIPANHPNAATDGEERHQSSPGRTRPLHQSVHPFGSPHPRLRPMGGHLRLATEEKNAPFVYPESPRSSTLFVGLGVGGRGAGGLC